MQDLSLHILDVAENGITSGATLVRITIDEDTAANRLTLVIEDNGSGMDEEFVAKVLDPFVTTRTTRKVGLGLPLLSQSAQEADGILTVKSKIGEGTIVRAEMSHDHIDRKPIGDMVETMATLIEGNATVDFVYTHRVNGTEYSLDTRDVRSELEEIPLNHPDVLALMRDNMREGLEEIGGGST